MKPKTVFTLAKKEFFGFINSPLAYTILVPFLLISSFLYLRGVLIVREASMRSYFEILPWFFLLLAPALSMKLLTDEYKEGTLELLFAHPLSELEIILGKFLGVIGFFLVILFTTLGLPIAILFFSKADPGIITAQYIGAFFLGLTFLAIGLAASAFVKNAISSFLLSAFISFLLMIVGWDFFTLMLAFPLDRIAAEISVLKHMESIARGVLDIRDIVYFLTICGLFLLLAIAKLSERKIIEDKGEKRKLKLGFSVVLLIGIVFNLFLSYYPLRIDLTSNKRFTLSDGTRQTMKGLSDRTTITVYASRNMPGPMQLVFTELTDLLKDYQRFSNKLIVKILYPDQDKDAVSQARSAGIEEVTFNRIGAGKFEIQSGFLGIEMRYGEKREVIPFINDASDLEYQLTKRIRKITSEKEKVIGIFQNSQEDYQIFREILQTQYETLSIGEDEKEKFDKVDTLVVIDDGFSQSTASAIISDYLEGAGKVLLLANGVSVDPQALRVGKSQSGIASFLKNYGVTLQKDLVYDLQLGETISFTQGERQYVAPYPFWLRALSSSSDFPPLAGIRNITLAWASSLKLEEKEGIKHKKILTTGQNAGRVEDKFDISPTAFRSLSPSSLEKLVLGVLVEKGDARLVVLGNSFLVGGQFLRNNRNNISFLASTVDWLAADKDLALIPSKIEGSAVFEFKNPTELNFFQYGNIFAPPILVVGFAVYYLRKRKRLAGRVYAKV